MASKLTEEQLKKIEENRRKALLKREQKIGVLKGNSSVASVAPGSFIQRNKNADSNKQPARSSSVTGSSTNQKSKSSADQFSTSSSSYVKTQFNKSESSEPVQRLAIGSASSGQVKMAPASSSNQITPKTLPYIPAMVVHKSNLTAENVSMANFKPAPMSSFNHSPPKTQLQTHNETKLKSNLATENVSVEHIKTPSCPTREPRIVSSSNTSTSDREKSAIDFDRIEQNRLKALAKRAERLKKSPAKETGMNKEEKSVKATNSAGSAASSGINKSISQSKPDFWGNTVGKAPVLLPSSSSCNSTGPAQQQAATAAPPGGQWNMFAGAGNCKVKGQCVLTTRERFTVNSGYCAPLIELFKIMNTKLYDAVTKKWSLHLSEYNRFMGALNSMGPGMEIEPLPKVILQVFAPAIRGQNSERHIPIADLSRVEPSLVNSLMSFQREGVNFGVYKNGRVLIADDMGLGKTIQAICLACYYRNEWPLLIVVPSSVRFDWAQNFQRWVPSIDPKSIHVAVTGKDSCTSGLVNILSYDLMARKAEILKNHFFQIVIMDECHLLKNFKTARCKAAVPIFKNAKRVILLSGTPALSRPLELFTQIDAVCPFLLKYHDFGVRYCDGKQHPWGWDFSASSNMAELQILLQEKIMIRRLKKDVLKELPDKIRQMILLDPSLIKIDKTLKNASKIMTSGNLKKTEERGALLDFFHKSGTAKMKAIRNYVEDLLEEEKKFLIFAHHGDVLDGIEEVVKHKIENNYIRIDGRTNTEARNILCQRFQHKDSVRVAILSITACNAGLNLSSASLVIFSELFWNPGILVQAEDRVHRIGQQDMVFVQYLVAKGTSDDHIWPMIQKKLDVLGKAGLTKDNFSTAETTQQMDPKQEEITKFLEESFADDFQDPVSSSLSPQEVDDANEFSVLTSSPPKVAKQQSITKYTSPMKDLPSRLEASLSSPSGQMKSKGLLKYFSPMKEQKEGSVEPNNNNKKQSLFTNVSDSRKRTADSASAECKKNPLDVYRQCHKDDEFEDCLTKENDDDLLFGADIEDEQSMIPQPVKKRKIEPFQPPFKQT